MLRVNDSKRRIKNGSACSIEPNHRKNFLNLDQKEHSIGGGFGSLATGIGHDNIPFAGRVILPAAKKLGRELVMSAASELIDADMKKKSLKQALNNTVTKIGRKQLGGGRSRRKTPTNGLRRRRSVEARKEKQPFEEKETSEKSSTFFLKHKK